MLFHKCIVSGRVLEYYQYERLPFAQTSGFRFKSRSRKVRHEHGSRRAENISRTRKNFIRLVQSNICGAEGALFLTLTMRDVVSIVSANELLKLFFMRLRYRFGKDFRYIAVPEFQKRGAVHYHCLLWGLSVTVEQERHDRILAKIWGEGFVDLAVVRSREGIAVYFAKYMSKAMHDVRLSGRKAYIYSRNCLRSVSVRSASPIDYAEQLWGSDCLKSVRAHDFKTQFLGKGRVEIFEINR